MEKIVFDCVAKELDVPDLTSCSYDSSHCMDKGYMCTRHPDSTTPIAASAWTSV